MKDRRLVVIGPGRVGLSAAAALDDEGLAVEVRGRSPRRPPFLEDREGIGYGTETGLPDAPGAPAALIFAVPDDALPRAARDWAASLGTGEVDAVALHTSGAHPPSVLSPLGEAGVPGATWHPLASVARPDPGALAGVAFGVAGEEPAVELGRRLARRVGARPLTVAAEGSGRYHASAVFASNCLAACLSVAADELAAATEGEGGLEDLLPLARGALDNLAASGLPEGLTGPVARGDAGTVRKHLAALEGDRRELYLWLARELLAVVESRVEPDRLEALRSALADDGGNEGSGA